MDVNSKILRCDNDMQNCLFTTSSCTKSQERDFYDSSALIKSYRTDIKHARNLGMIYIVAMPKSMSSGGSWEDIKKRLSGLDLNATVDTSIFQSS